MPIELIKALTKIDIENKNSDNRRQIGILSGKFNPVHNAHLLIADQVCQALNLDKVLLMPTPSETIERINMLELALREVNINKLSIEMSAFIEPEASQYDVIKSLKASNPEVDFYYILGADNFSDVESISKIEELLPIVNLVGVRREGHTKTPKYPIIWVDVPSFNVSSSYIRKQIKEGKMPNYLLPKSVLTYILEENLYV